MNALADRRTKLGRTDLDVCRIGIGGGNALSASDLLYAVSRGVNYIFTSTDLHAVTYRRSWSALRRLGRGTRRDSVAIVVCSYVCDPEKLMGLLIDQLLALKLDYVDVFQWGWVTRQNDGSVLLHAADSVLRSDVAARYASQTAVIGRQVGDEMRRRGYARYLGISTHDRGIARELAADPNLDVLMVRYNIAHRGAESEIFPHLPVQRPGIIAFNTSHDVSGMLSVPPPSLPPGRFVPTVPHLYRYCLDNPNVDVVLAGPSNRAQLEQGLSALDMPPHDERMTSYLRKYGDLHAGKVTVASA